MTDELRQKVAKAVREGIDLSPHLSALHDVGPEYHGEARDMLYIDGAFDLGGVADRILAIPEIAAALESLPVKPERAPPFRPAFVDLVRNYTSTAGAHDFQLGAAVRGYSSFINALNVGDRFYYSCISIDKPVEREIGRGTLLPNGVIARQPISGGRTSFSEGAKSVALISAAEWFGGLPDSSLRIG